MQGIVIMFNYSKGYGFIETGEGKDVFFHSSQLLIPGENYKTIAVGEKVEFELEESERGYHATNIKIIK